MLSKKGFSPESTKNDWKWFPVVLTTKLVYFFKIISDDKAMSLL